MANLPEPDKKTKWVLTQSAFQRLVSWLDENNQSTGERYVVIRRRLSQYFDRKNCSSPFELADETLNRVARRLEQEGEITDSTPSQFCFNTARYVFLESLRRKEHNEPLPEDLAKSPQFQEEGEWEQLRSNCLEKCLQKLDSEDRIVILGYYQGERRLRIENRKLIAAKLGVSMNALTIRACRIRTKLELCIRKCLNNEK
jgi:DNA-directed RNA polymerase specialized sigma24 family protein